MNAPVRFICLGAATLSLSACSLPNYTQPQAAAPAAPVAQAAATPALTAIRASTSTTQVADTPEVIEEEVIKPKNTWGHQRLGPNDPMSDGGDEDSGWG